MTTDAKGITFEVERWTTAPSRVEVSGRWYGVRGRRFVRPTLTVLLATGGAEKRLLADLEHKPWAAEDGEPWRAAFALEDGLPPASRIELSVAPDITVELAIDEDAVTATPASGRRAPVSSAAHARSPVIRDDPARPRPRAPRSPEVERLRERLALAESAVARERTRREAGDGALEEQRRSVRTLQAEVGRLRAELELAKTVGQELETAEGGLDKLRRESREAGRERDQIVSDRDDALRELAAEQAAADRLRSQLADAEAAVRRLTQAGREARSAAESRAGRPRAAADPQTAAESEPDDDPEPTRRMPLPHGEATERQRGETFDRAAPLPRTERPLNPSLRTSNWVGRGIAVVVMVIVIAAIVIVINSTVH